MYDIVNPCPYFQGRTMVNGHGCVVCNRKALHMTIYPVKTCVADNGFRDCPQYRYMKICEIYKNKKEN